MNKKFKKIELLAPAGNLEKMKTAFAFGADAVYLGIPDFSLRVRINDFTLSKIKEATQYAHKVNPSTGLRTGKVYVTVNIFAHNEHFKKLPSYIKKLKEIGVDGLIISDPGVMSEVKKLWPKARIHLSTQANCTNATAVKFWQKQGVSRIILARELSLSEIKEIKSQVPKLELECFIHGALCMSYSGRCFLSKFFNDRNANLGDCSQPCRWKYTRMARKKMNGTNASEFIKAKPHEEILELVEDTSGSYILNSKDLCLINRLPEIMHSGVSSFKIEGRAKSVYYLANVVGAYRRAIDIVLENKGKQTTSVKKELNFLYKELEEKLYHRGYTEGFMFNQGKEAQNLANSHNLPKWEFCGQVESPAYAKALVGKQKSIKLKVGSQSSKVNGQLSVRVHNTMKVGDRIEIVRPDYDIIKMKVKNMINIKTNKEIKEAHGGGSGDVVALEINEDVPEYSVIRRRVT